MPGADLVPVPEEILRLGRRRFDAGQRIEMTALAAELGVNRVTPGWYPWPLWPAAFWGMAVVGQARVARSALP